ncbi:MAG: hypothetical protein S4CHLAM6_05860 [Chlamydiae bacterium]|nr:hypothetical protein [Chlamydiota bacterium]
MSFEYALQYYGLIPESVTKLTCASYKKSKLFETPIGDFVYKTVTKKTFPIGITRKNINDETSFLIALKEKALTDYLTHLKPFSTQEDLMQYLVEGMRIEKTNILSLDFKIIEEISEDSRNPNINLLWKILKK